MTIYPAYGRNYKDAESVKKDIDGYKDFSVSPGGPYVNKEELIKLGYTEVYVKSGLNIFKVKVN